MGVGGWFKLYLDGACYCNNSPKLREDEIELKQREHEYELMIILATNVEMIKGQFQSELSHERETLES